MSSILTSLEKEARMKGHLVMSAKERRRKVGRFEGVRKGQLTIRVRCGWNCPIATVAGRIWSHPVPGTGLDRKGVCMISSAQDSDGLDSFLTKVTAQNKLSNYQAGLRGYGKFLGKKKTAWFDPPTEVWSFGDLNVKINPELGLSINKKSCVIKLYFKSKPLAKNQIYVILSLMHQVLSSSIPQGCEIAMLDVQRGKLLLPTRLTPKIDVLLRGEAASFLQMWEDL